MKLLGAFGLGLLSFVWFMFVGETLGLVTAFVTMAVYFFICQLLLSRGHADAHREDWPLMLALDAVMLIVVIVMIMVEKPGVILSQGPGALASTIGGTYAGAIVASRAARRATVRH